MCEVGCVMMHVWKPGHLQELVLSYHGNLGPELRLADLSLSAPELSLWNLMVNDNKNWKNSKHHQDTAFFCSSYSNSSHGKDWDTDPQGFSRRQTLLGHTQWTTSCSRCETFSNAGSEICLNDSHVHFLQLLVHCHLLEVSKNSLMASLTNK